MERKKSLRGRVTSQWSRPQFRKFWIAGACRIGKKEKRTTGSSKNGGIMEQRRHSCEAVGNSDESSGRSFWRNYSYWRKELEWYFCLSKFQRKYLWNRSLEIGHEIGTPLWSKRKRNGQCCASEIDGSKIATSVSENWKDTNSLTLIGSSISTKEATKRSFNIAEKSQDALLYIWALVDGPCRCPIQMERIPASSRMLFWYHFKPQVRTDSWTKREQRGTTNRLLPSLQPVRRQPRWRRTLRRLIEAEKSTLSQHLEASSRRHLLDQFSPSNRWTSTWRWFDLQILRDLLDKCLVSLESCGESAMVWILCKHSTRTQSVLHQFQLTLCKNWTVENSST